MSVIKFTATFHIIYNSCVYINFSNLLLIALYMNSFKFSAQKNDYCHILEYVDNLLFYK